MKHHDTHPPVARSPLTAVKMRASIDARDRGLSVVEIVLAVVISSMVMGVLAAVLATSLSAGAAARDSVMTSNDAQLISTFFTRDAQSVGRSGVDVAFGDPSVALGVSTAPSPSGGGGCTQSGDLVIRFAWLDDSVEPSSPPVPVIVTYALDAEGQLLRATCVAGMTSTLTLASQVDEATATCLPLPGCGVLTTMIALTVRGATETGGPYEYDLTAAVRPDEMQPPVEGPGAPLVLLGTATCPTLDLGASTVVMGSALIDGRCGAAPIAGDLTDLTSEDTIVGDLVDPFGDLDPPFGRCGTPGTEPQLGRSPTAESWVVHHEPVVIGGDVAFDAGRYLFCAGVQVGDGARVTGSSVSWFVASGQTSVAADATVRMQPPSSGPYAALSLWTAAGEGVVVAAGTSVDEIGGVVYAPNGPVQMITPRGLHLGGVVAERLVVDGDGVVRIGRPVPQLQLDGTPSLTIRRGEVVALALPTMSGGTAPYVWQEQMLVPGLWLAADGSVSGRADTLATTAVDAIVRDATGATLVVPLAIDVVATPAGCPSSSTGWWGQYWTNPNLAGAPQLCRLDLALSFDWGTGAPALGVPVDGFSVRWTRAHDFAAGDYVFTVRSDDGVRLFIDGQLVVDRWAAHGVVEETIPVTLTAGLKTLVLEYVDHAEAASAGLSWTTVPPPSCPATVNGWRGEYFRNTSLVGLPAVCRDESVVDFDWGSGSPAGLGHSDSFSARWTRTQELVAGTYTFRVGGDDGVRLFLDGVPILDDWRDTAYAVRTVSRTVAEGPHTLVLEYYEGEGPARATLDWFVTAQPAAPRNVVARPGDTTASVSWTPGPTSGEAPVTSYTVTSTAAGFPTRTCTATAPATTCTLTGLTNGVRHVMTVTATNATGTSDIATASVMPFPAVLVGGNGQLWLDATDPDGDGANEGAGERCDTTVECSSADRLIRWRDKSGRGNHAVQTTSTQAGRFDSALPAVDFDANGWYDVNVGVGPDMTTFVVAQSDTPTWNTWGWIASARGPNGWLIHPWPGGATVGWFPVDSGGSYLGQITMSVTDLAAPHAYDLTQAGSHQIILTAGLDGRASTWSQSTNSPRTAGTTTVRIGADSWGVRLGDGKYREVIVLDRALTANERRVVQEYLARKWSLTITPSVPRSPAATPGNGSATVSWTAPAWDGGSAVTGYRATATPGGATCTAPASATSCTISGLANGTAHTVVVTASNVRGEGPVSSATAVVTPGPPPAPTGLGAVGGDASAAVSWTAPTLDGHAPVTSYTVTATAPEQPTVTCTASSPTTSCQLTSLTNGSTYTVSVTATNANGTSAASSSVTVTPEWSPTRLGGALTWWYDADAQGALTSAWATDTGYTVSGQAGSTTLVTSSGVVERIDVVSAGTGYTSNPTVTVVGGGGTGAGVYSVSRNGTSLYSVWAGLRGSGYTTEPTVRVSGGGGSGASLRAILMAPVPVGARIRVAGQVHTVVERDGLTLTVTPPLPATVSAQAVERQQITSWQNRSTPGSFDASQNVAARRPTVGVINGRSAVVFDGFDDWLSVLDPSATPYDKGPTWTLVVAYQVDRQVTSGAVFQSINGYNARVLASRGATQMDYLSAENLYLSAGTSLPSDSLPRDGDTARVATISGSGDTFDWVQVGLGTAMTNSYNPDWGFTGRIGEVIFVNGGLSSPDVAKAQGYLQRKWGSPAAVPGAPISVSARPGDAQLAVTWRGATPNGSPVTGSTATATAAGQPTRTCTTTTLGCTITGLTNGLSYSVRVTSTNVVGTGPASIAVAATPVPSLVTSSSAVLWLDAADTTTLWSDAAGTVNAGTGAALARWDDKSAQTNTPIQATTGNRPALSIDGGRAVPVFDGVDDTFGLDPSRLPMGTAASTTFVVARLGNSNHVAAVDWGTNATGQRRFHGAYGGTRWRYLSAGSVANPFTTTWPVGSSALLVGEFSSAGGTVWADGAVGATVTGAISTGSTYAQVGGLGSQVWGGSISEIVVFDRVLTANERRTVEDYLRRKWGFAITPDAPTGVTATAGAGAATVSWTVPSDGGSAVTSTTVTASPGGATCTTSGTSCTVTGLANGTSYTFTVRATNAVGAGPVSAPSGSVTPLAPISGAVFEDVNYGGGAGRSLAASSGARVSGARVELYTASGSYVTATTTAANGTYSFGSLADGGYLVRVVSSTVLSTRTGATSSLLPVLTYRTTTVSGTTSPVTDVVGGTNPGVGDAGAASAGATVSPSTGVFSAGPTGTAQALAPITVGGAGASAVDFGFNFTTVTNTNDSGAGSLRQAITNANALGGDSSLTVAGRTASIEHVVFMMPNGTNAAGLRSTFNAFTTNGGSGVMVATITTASSLPSITTPMVIDAQQQPGWSTRPIVELNGTFSAGNVNIHGLVIGSGGAGSSVRGFVVNRFGGRGIHLSNAANVTVQGNWLGLSATGGSGQGNGVHGISVAGAGATGVIVGGTTAAQRNVISGNGGGIVLETNPSTVTVSGNFVGTDPTGLIAVGNTNGIWVALGTTNSTIGGTTAGSGNLIAGNSNTGVLLANTGTTGNVVQGNTIGLNANGNSLANGTGILIITGASSNTIGGTTSAARNVISGNTNQGININGSGTNGNVVQGNWIGTDVTGTAARPNLIDGIIVATSAASTQIGGTAAGAGNVISGNTRHGITVSSVSGTVIQGNWIGLNAAGTAALANGNDGVTFNGTATGNLVGGAATGAGNVISGNARWGVSMAAGADGQTVQGNTIGRNPGNTADVPNVSDGIGIVSNANIVGGTAAGAGNVIAGNGRAGVYVNATTATGNRISGNSIFGNAGLGIDLTGGAAYATPDGVTANDGTTSSGPNRFVDRPVITGASLNGQTLTVTGYVGSAAGQAAFANHVVEIFVAAADPTGSGEGRTYLGSISTSSTTGDFSGTVVAAPSVAQAGTLVTATATNPSTNDTSEFAANATITGASITGTVFEDLNYGGGPGRPLATALGSGGSGRSGARVELYDAAGSFVTSTTTAANGSYAFTVQPGATYQVRVVNTTVSSARAGWLSWMSPVQTFRTSATSGTVASAVTTQVGGASPSRVDAGNGSTTLTALNSATVVPQSLSSVVVGVGGMSGVDFGFTFNAIVNTNPTGQGSLADWAVAARRMSPAGLAISGQPANRSVSIFMIPSSSDPLGRPVDPRFSSGRFVINAPFMLLASSTVLDATTQTSLIGDTNPGVLGAGGTVGVAGTALATVPRPEIELVGAPGTLPLMTDNSTSDITIRGIAIWGYGSTVGGYSQANIFAGDPSTNLLIEQNVIGATALSFSDPGANRTPRNNIIVRSGASQDVVIRNNLIGFAGCTGVTAQSGQNAATGNGVLLQGNEIRGNGLLASSGCSGAGVQLDPAANVVYAVRDNLIADNAGSGVHVYAAARVQEVRGNTITGNGRSAGAATYAGASSTAGVTVFGTTSATANGVTVQNNVVSLNYGAGAAVRGAQNQPVRITANSIFDNGEVSRSDGAAASGGIGIDLEVNGTGVTANSGARDATQPNQRMNTPVITSASLSGTTLSVTGYIGTAAGQTTWGGSTVEVFVADPDPTGVGEGRTLLGSLIADANGNVSGTVTAPLGTVTSSSRLTATAIDPAGNTSEFSANVTVTVPVLDQTSTPAAAAYGLRLLDNDHTGPFVQVRRSSDGTTANIGPATTTRTRTNLATTTTNNAAGLAPTGVTMTITGAGAENGQSYVEVRWQGTNTSGADGWVQWVHGPNGAFDASTHAGVSPASTITVSAGVRLVAGTQPPGTPTLRSIERNASGVFVTQALRSITVDTSTTRWAVSGVVAAGTAYVQPNIYWPITNGASVDMTVRFYQPNVEVGVGNPVVMTTRNTPTVIARPGDLDLEALAAFVGTGDGTVSVWYDQSGNGRNLTQATPASQPRIVSAGVVETRSGRPAIAFWGVAQGSPQSLALSTSMTTVGGVTAVVQFANDPAARGFLLSDSGSSYFWHSSMPTGLIESTWASASVRTGTAWNNGTSVTPTALPWPVNPAVVTLMPSTPGSGTTWNNLGNDRGNGWHLNLGSAFSELVLSSTAWSTADRQTLERNAGAYFGVTVA